MAGHSRLAEPASEPVHTGELSGLPIWQHPSYVLYGRRKGRRFSVYIPEELVPEVRRCLDNGRALQELLYEAAARYVKALKRERMTAEQSND
jgi:hypothetical protein